MTEVGSQRHLACQLVVCIIMYLVLSDTLAKYLIILLSRNCKPILYAKCMPEHAASYEAEESGQSEDLMHLDLYAECGLNQHRSR